MLLARGSHSMRFAGGLDADDVRLQAYETPGGGALRNSLRRGLSNSMIPAFMLVFSVGALVQFFVSYCRSILATYAKLEVSVRTREIAGIESERISSGEFGRLLGLLRLARSPADDRMELLTVRLYYSVLQVVGSLGTLFTSTAREWSENEKARCAYFAAVALDRRIAVLAQ
jgi:hypothetical protein